MENSLISQQSIACVCILMNCEHDHVTCGCENNKRNVNSGMDENIVRSQEKSNHKAFAPAKAKIKDIWIHLAGHLYK